MVETRADAMTGRPELLFPLFSDIKSLQGIGPRSAQLLEKLGIRTPKDLLLNLPTSVIDRRRRETVEDAAVPSIVTVQATILRHRAPQNPKRPYRIDVADSKVTFQLVFFRGNRKWLQEILPEGEERLISGRLERFDGLLQVSHPDFVVEPGRSSEIPEFEPVYPLTEGISQKVMFRAISQAVRIAPTLDEWIDPELRTREGWPSWKQAIVDAHSPVSSADVLPTNKARQRIAYDELFAHQITLAVARANRRKAPGNVTRSTGRLQKEVRAKLPFSLTNGQKDAIEEILRDMSAPTRMNRLLQGDVGSGKTVVALMALLAAVEAGGQGTLMAPTEVLARQHLASLSSILGSTNVRMDILTGRDKGRERQRKLEALAIGKIDILIGTHSLFQKDIAFKDLRIAIIDEQHRFGVSERLALSEKGHRTDVLVMTATPIPRSLSLASYGDMDVSILRDKPAGRPPVKTSLVSEARIQDVVSRLRDATQSGRQAYWVCPLVEESEVVDLAAAEERFKMLRAKLPNAGVALVHGRMTPEEKDSAMSAFQSGTASVLVATTVIEVGVDVPNASIMVIDRAERFGLAQLHQLRGRVGRGHTESSCLLLFGQPLGETARRRLETIRDTTDGFEIAEVDLEIRGAGDLLGTAQAGLPRFRVADLERQSGLMALAQSDARRLLDQDAELSSARGIAVRHLLWLLEQDKAIRLLSVG